MTAIVSPPGLPSGAENFTHGAYYTLKYSADVINASWNLALTKSTELDTAIADATTSFLDLLTVPTVNAGTAMNTPAVEPTITIADAATSTIYSDFETQYLELVALLVTKFAAFQTEFFPDDKVFYTQAEDWLQAALADPSGLPAAVRSQLLADAQAVIVAETSRAKDSVLQTFATRRFPVPSGQALSATLQLDQSAQDKLAQASRDITKMSVEQLRFVVEKALACRTIAMDSAIKYITALASGPDMSSRLVGIGYDAQSKMVSAASQFYNSRIAAADQVSKVSQYNVSTTLDAASKNQAAELRIVDDKLKALLAEVSALSQMANALFNNLHANAGTQYSISAS